MSTPGVFSLVWLIIKLLVAFMIVSGILILLAGGGVVAILNHF
jgi:hypothetical protein